MSNSENKFDTTTEIDPSELTEVPPPGSVYEAETVQLPKLDEKSILVHPNGAVPVAIIRAEGTARHKLPVGLLPLPRPSRMGRQVMPELYVAAVGGFAAFVLYLLFQF